MCCCFEWFKGRAAKRKQIYYFVDIFGMPCCFEWFKGRSAKRKQIYYFVYILGMPFLSFFVVNQKTGKIYIISVDKKRGETNILFRVFAALGVAVRCPGWVSPLGVPVRCPI